MKIVVLDAQTLGDDVSLAEFSKLGTVEIYPMTAPQMVAERICDCDVVILNKVILNAQNLAGAKNLRLICVAATGYDNIDCEYCAKNQIAVCNVCGYSTNSVAQLTVALALSLLNHLPAFDGFVKDQRYTQSGVQNCLVPYFHEISGMTWGIAGMGNIGRKVAEIAKALGCRVIAYKRTPDPEFACTDLETLCRESDILSVHLPLTDATRRLFDQEHIAMMKKTAVFINVARGAVADEEALVQAMEKNQLGGLGIDVYDGEPMAQNSPYQRILDHPNVLLTPHMAWAAHEARVRCLAEIRENIAAFYRGETRNRVEK